MTSRLDGEIARSNESNRVLLTDLRQAIAQLEEPYRRVATLRHLEGCSYRELARRLHVPDATAATRLHRAHARLRELVRRKIATTKHAGRPSW